MDIEKLFQDEEFKAQIKNAKDLKEVAGILQSKGFDVTPEVLAANMSSESELNEDMLENVAGGASGWIKKFLDWWRKSLPTLIC